MGTGVGAGVGAAATGVGDELPPPQCGQEHEDTQRDELPHFEDLRLFRALRREWS